MAEINFSGLDELTLSLEEVAELPDEVIDEMLNAGADIVVAAQKRTANALLWKPWENPAAQRSYSPGTTAKSIRKGKPKRGKGGGRVIFVTPSGKRTRGGKRTGRRHGKQTFKISNAEIGFYNEFGTRKIHERDFIRIANELSAEACTAAQMAVYDKYLQSKNL